MGKRGQAATEFMMTYGWMILVIMVILSVLFATGVFDVKTPDTCFTPNPYNCIDTKLSGNVFELRLSASGIDSGSDDNKINRITINGQNCAVLGNGVIKGAEDSPVTSTCNLANNIGEGRKFEGSVELGYRKFGGNIHIVNGRFSGTSEG
jgi:hypothetical protein